MFDEHESETTSGPPTFLGPLMVTLWFVGWPVAIRGLLYIADHGLPTLSAAMAATK